MRISDSVVIWCIIKAYLMPETARITLRTASLLDAIVDRLANVPDIINFRIVMVKFVVAVVLIAVLSPIVIGITPGEMINRY